MPFTSSWKKKPIRCEFRRSRCRPARRGGCLRSADHELGISLYLPAPLILNRKNLPFTRSPLESNFIGWPSIEVDSFVFLIAASTLLRLGVCPALQTAEIAWSTTCVAEKTGGP